MTPAAKVLVVGLGNTLRGDDALGRVAAERLADLVEPDAVCVIDQDGPTPELAAQVAAVELAIFLDASVHGPAEGAVARRLEPGNSLDPIHHQLDLSSVLGLARELYGSAPEAFAITARGASFACADSLLSREAELGCEAILRETLRIIHTHDTRGVPS